MGKQVICSDCSLFGVFALGLVSNTTKLLLNTEKKKYFFFFLAEAVSFVT